MKALAALVLLVALVACSGPGDDDSDGGDGDGGDRARDRASSAPPEVPDADTPDTAPELAATEVCDLVREGIDQFNLGDLTGTIEQFEDAVPLAEELADEQPSDKTDTLLDAVRYYAELPADDYVEASTSSPEFLRFKAFTLTECAYGAPPAEATEPALPA